MEKNKTGTYFKYAIGEISLVVIGILIALQINNWNENLKNRTLEAYYLDLIHEEFLANKTQFETIFALHKKGYHSSQWLLSHMPLQNAPKDSLWIHLNQYKLARSFNPSQSSIEAIINNGHLNLIRDKTLRTNLLKWKDLVLDYSEEEVINHDHLMQTMKPFDIKHFRYFENETQNKYKNILHFDEKTMNEFLNNVAIKGALLSNIVNNLEATEVKESIELILKKTVKQ